MWQKFLAQLKTSIYLFNAHLFIRTFCLYLTINIVLFLAQWLNTV